LKNSKKQQEENVKGLEYAKITKTDDVVGRKVEGNKPIKQGKESNWTDDKQWGRQHSVSDKIGNLLKGTKTT